MRRAALMLVLFWLVFACKGQTPAVPTNTTLLGDVAGAFAAVLTHTNWYVGTYGLYAPGLKHKYGYGLAAVYPLSAYVETGLRLDCVNGGFYMPSGNATFQVPLHLSDNVILLPFGYTGVGLPLAGATLAGVQLPGQPPKENNGQPTAIFGYGFALSLWKRSEPSQHWYQLDSILIVADEEKWTGFEKLQVRCGLFANKKF